MYVLSVCISALIFNCPAPLRNQNSIISIVTRLQAANQRNSGCICGKDKKILSLCQSVQNGTGVH